MAPNLGDRLRTFLRGRRSTAGLDVVRPRDPSYESVRHVYMATGSPAAVVRVRTSAEVPDALAFALAHGGPFAVRSGGHGISSLATNVGGAVIDLSRLDDIELLGGRRVRIGAGARWGQVAQALYPHGLALSSGDSGDVGVGGLATAGGIGLLGRRYGLTIDHLVAAEMVTADGTVHRVSAEDDPDLFWAIRGAGANFGVVTAFEFDAAPTPTVGQGLFLYRPTDLPGFLEQWGRTVERAPREITAFLVLDGPIASATVAYAGDDPKAMTAAMEPFTTLPGLSAGKARTVPYSRLPVTTGDVHRGAAARPGPHWTRRPPRPRDRSADRGLRRGHGDGADPLGRRGDQRRACGRDGVRAPTPELLRHRGVLRRTVGARRRVGAGPRTHGRPVSQLRERPHPGQRVRRLSRADSHQAAGTEGEVGPRPGLHSELRPRDEPTGGVGGLGVPVVDWTLPPLGVSSHRAGERKERGGG